MRLGRVIALLTAAGLAIGLAACGDDDDDAATTTSTSSTTSTTEATSTSATSTSEPTTSSTAGSQPCGDVGRPGPTGNVREAEADVDGDGRTDALVTYSAGGNWHLRVELASSGSSDIVVGPMVAGGEVSPIGGVDLDGAGGDEVWARVGSGASATIVGLFRFVNCGLEPVNAGDARAEFAVGASVGSTSGVECSRNAKGGFDVVELSGTSDDGRSYDVRATRYVLDDGTLTVAARSGPTRVAATSSGFDRYTSFRCGDLRA